MLGQGLRLTLLGSVLGLVGAFGISRLLDTMMFGGEASTPLIYGTVSILFVGAVSAASYFPAHAATRIDPVGTLKEQ